MSERERESENEGRGGGEERKKRVQVSPREIPSNSTPLTEATGHQLYTPKLAHSSTKKLGLHTSYYTTHTWPQRDLKSPISILKEPCFYNCSVNGELRPPL